MRAIIKNGLKDIEKLDATQIDVNFLINMQAGGRLQILYSTYELYGLHQTRKRLLDQDAMLCAELDRRGHKVQPF